MATDARRALVIDFKAKGSPKLIKAIGKLAATQQKLNVVQKKTAKTQHLVNHRVSANTKAVIANTTVLTKAQSVIAMYRNRMLLASFAVTFATTAFVAFVKMAGKQEDSVRRLADVFGGKGAESLDEYSSELQKISVYGDENINVLMAQIGAFGANVEQTKALTKATIDLAAGLGLDLNTAGLLVAKTIGSSTDALTRYGVGADGATDKTEKIANIVSSVEEKFGGLAKKLSQTTSGQLAQASNAFGDFGEELGRAFAPMVLLVAKGLKTLAENLDAEKIKKFIGAVTALVVVTKIWRATTLSSALTMKRLSVILKALKAQYILLTTATGASTAAQKLYNASLISGKRAWQGLTLAIKRNPIGIIAAIAGVAALALANFFGVFEDGTEVLSDEEKEQTKADDALKEYIITVADVNDSMQKKLNLLKANTEIEKFAIENGIELKDVNTELFYEIERMNDALEEQERINKERIKTEREVANILKFVDNIGKDSTTVKLEGYRDVLRAEKVYLDSLGESSDASLRLKKAIGELNTLIANQGKKTNNARIELRDLNYEYKEYALQIKKTAAEDGNTSNFELRNDLLEKRQEHLDKLHKLQRELLHDDDESNDNLITSNMLNAAQQQLDLDEILLANEKRDAIVSANFEIANSVLSIGESYVALEQARLNSDKSAEIAAANSIKSERKRQRAIEDINKKYADKQEELNKKSKKIKRVQTVVNTSVGIMEALSDKTIVSTWQRIAMATLIGVQGAMQLAQIDAAKYEYGGMVGGRRHSQGGTVIEAERGEYVVSRKGVEATGIESLNRINAGGGGGGINVSINNPILSKDVVEDDLIPQIKEAIRRGADIGVG